MSATIKIVVEVSGGLDTIKRDIDDLGETAKKAGGGFNALQEMAIGAFRQIGTIGVDLALSGLQKLGGFIVDSIGVAGDFQAKMNEVGAALGAGFEPGSESLNEFKDLFISLGKELPVSTAEVQDAALALVKGGLDPAVVRAGALRDSLNFAAAAGMGLAEAAELTIKQLGTFVPIGASVTEQTEFMANAQNLLVKAAGASTLNVDALGDAMLAAGGQARAAGLDYEEFVTTMGLISPSFGSAAEAGTSFKNFLTRLNPSTKAAKDAMAELGLMTTSTTKIMQFLQERGIEPLGTDLDTLGNQFTELMVSQGQTAKETGKIWDTFAQSTFFDMDGKFIGMAAASDQLKGALTGLSDQQRIATLQAIFGNDAMGAATALAGAGAEGYQAFADKMLAANGVAGQAAATQQGFNFQMENMKGSLEALQITIGTALLPVLADLIGNYITPGINAVMGLTEAFIKGGAGTSVFGNAADVLIQTLTSIWEVIQNQVWPILQNLGMTLMPIVSAAVQVLAGLWSDVLWPSLQNFGQLLTTVVLPLLNELSIWLRDNLPPAVQMVADFLTNILFPALNTVYTFIGTNVIPLIATLFTWLQTTIPAGIQTLANFWNTVLLPAINAVWAFIQNFLIPLFTALVNLHLAVLGLALRTLTSIWSTVLLPAITAVWTFIQNQLGPIFTWLDTMILTPLLQTLKNIGFFVLGALMPYMQNLAQVISGTVTSAFGTLETVAGNVRGALKSIGDAVSGVISWLNDLISTINSVSIPDWLEGHSPPPMANWFSDIGGAVGALNAQLPDLQAQLTAQIGPQGQSISNTASTRSFSYSPTIYSSGGTDMPMDLALASSLAMV